MSTYSIIADGKEIFPDSRAKSAKGSVRRVDSYGRVTNWIPVYCANCGDEHGSVPEENCTFACFLCDLCAEKMGDKLTDKYTEPDTIFWQRVADEQLDKHQQILGLPALLHELENTNSPLAKLFKDRLSKGPL